MCREERRWGKLLFSVYCIWMLWLLFGQRIGYAHGENFRDYLAQSVNLSPFKTIGNYIYAMRRTSDRELLRHIVINLAGNVVLFIPLGYFLPLNWNRFRGFLKWLLGVSGIIAAVEVLQMLTRLGSMDVDDLILNLTGAAVGYLIWKRKESVK